MSGASGVIAGIDAISPGAWIALVVVGSFLAYVFADALRYWRAKPVTDLLEEVLAELKRRDPPVS